MAAQTQPEAPAIKQPTEPQSDASEALKVQISALREAEELQGKEARRRDWVVRTPAAQQHFNGLGVLHHAAINSGLVDCSPGYFDFLEQGLATLDAQEPAKNLASEMHQRLQDEARKQPPPPPPRTDASFVSAPVSRNVPSGSGQRFPMKVTLSPEEKDAARMSGISEADYAKQKIKLMQMKANGAYGDRR
jgi:hypothetical protein